MSSNFKTWIKLAFGVVRIVGGLSTGFGVSMLGSILCSLDLWFVAIILARFSIGKGIRTLRLGWEEL